MNQSPWVHVRRQHQADWLVPCTPGSCKPSLKLSSDCPESLLLLQLMLPTHHATDVTLLVPACAVCPMPTSNAVHQLPACRAGRLMWVWLPIIAHAVDLAHHSFCACAPPRPCPWRLARSAADGGDVLTWTVSSPTTKAMLQDILCRSGSFDSCHYIPPVS